ncbi:MAG: hypothetical protein GY822_10230 [Deltaproteobacteria bacterium]|nr:hypothetical protein [Deltaproteobacteria bacterium]
MESPSKSMGGRMGRWCRRPFTWLAPEETFSSPAWPTTLLLRPLPMFCLAILVANDHFLKGSGLLPGWLTGKLSDVTGLFFFPLLLLTLWNLCGVLIRQIHPIGLRMASANLNQLLVCIALTCFFFSALQLSPFAADVVVFYGGRLLGAPVRVTQDVTDLFTLGVLLATWRFGRKRISCLPPGRIVLLRSKMKDQSSRRERVSIAKDAFNDVVTLGCEDDKWAWKKLVEDVADHRETQILDEQLAWLRRGC